MELFSFGATIHAMMIGSASAEMTLKILIGFSVLRESLIVFVTNVLATESATITMELANRTSEIWPGFHLAHHLQI